MYVKQKTGIKFALCHATCLHLTSSNDQCLVPSIITSLRPVGGKELMAYADCGL